MKQPHYSAGIGTILLATVIAMAPAEQSFADDEKGISATECQPFLPTTYETAVFKDNAIHNPSTVNQRVICPLNKDAFANWGPNDVKLTAYVKAGTKPGKVSCTVFGAGASFGSAQVAYTNTSATLDPGAADDFDINGIVDPAQEQDNLNIEGWNVLCTLNPGMSLGGFFFAENLDTDGNG